MAAFSSIAIGLGVAASVAGVGYSAISTNKAAKEQKAASTRAENARQQQNELDAMRRRRQAVRQAMLARSQAVSAGVNQGASLQGSGVLAGAGNAYATGQQNQQTITAGQLLGNQVFDANRAYASATARGQQGAAWGNALANIGGMLISNAGTINRLGGGFGGGSGMSYVGPEWPQGYDG